MPPTPERCRPTRRRWRPGRSRGVRHRTRWTAAAALIAIAITILSSIPAETLARTGISIWDKAVHFSVWLALTFCAARGQPRDARRQALVIAVCTVFGVVDELHQSMTPGREMSAFDVVADAAGALAGALLAAQVRRWRDRRRRQPYRTPHSERG